MTELPTYYWITITMRTYKVVYNCGPRHPLSNGVNVTETTADSIYLAFNRALNEAPHESFNAAIPQKPQMVDRMMIQHVRSRKVTIRTKGIDRKAHSVSFHLGTNSGRYDCQTDVRIPGTGEVIFFITAQVGGDASTFEWCGRCTQEFIQAIESKKKKSQNDLDILTLCNLYDRHFHTVFKNHKAPTSEEIETIESILDRH